MFDKMKALFEMQKKMQQMKQELDNTIFEVVSSDGLVKITMNGAQQVKGVNIRGELGQTDKAALEKASTDAYNRAIKRAQEIAAGKMKDISGIDLPGLA